MHIDFNDLKRVIIHIFLDDLTMHCNKRDDFFDHLKQTFLRCKKFGISFMQNQLFFGITEGKLLGHILSKYGVSIDPKRILAIQNFPTPTSKKYIQTFIGKINFIWRFVPNVAQIINPIHLLICNDVVFYWNDDTQVTFWVIKDSITSSPFLAKFDCEKDFNIYTHATKQVPSSILIHFDSENYEKPIAFMSQILTEIEVKFPLFEKHALALVIALNKFKHYVFGRHTIVKVPLPTTQNLYARKIIKLDF